MSWRLRTKRRLRHSEIYARASDGVGSCSGGKFVLSRAAQAYDAQARDPNRKFQLDSINQHERERESLMRVRMNLRQCVWVLAVALGTGVTGGTVRAAASPLSQDQGHEQDYSKNKTYQQGMREGQDDRKHNKEHSKKRHFKKDEDQKAYESGYQQGHQGDQHDH